jgi:hypothetical protein
LYCDDGINWMLIIFPTSQTQKPMNLEQASQRLAQLSGTPLRPFSTRDFGREQNPGAKSVLVPDERAQAIVFELRAELSNGLITFVGCTHSLAEPPAPGSEVVVAAGSDQFDILRVAQSDAVNFDMDTEDLIRKLQEYDTAHGIDIFHAETDTIEFRFRKIPRDMNTFCKDLYEFCPDIVDQGVGSIEALQKEISETGTVYLWWD